MSTSIHAPYKGATFLLALRHYGASGWVWHRYARATEDVQYNLGDGAGTATFTAAPNMAPRIPKQKASLGSAEPLIVRLPVDAFLTRLSDGMPHAPVFVRFAELLTTGGMTDQLLTHYLGRLSIATRNPDGKPDLVELEFVNFKHRLKLAMGVPANHTCAWTFGDDSGLSGVAGPNCKIDASALLQTGTVSAVAAKAVTITGLTTPSGTANDNYWRRGWVSVGHLLIQIRDWSRTTPTAFQLVKQPPIEWVGASVVVCPGCEKNKTVCDQRWGNIANFMGFGDAIPSRNPTQELP